MSEAARVAKAILMAETVLAAQAVLVAEAALAAEALIAETRVRARIEARIAVGKARPAHIRRHAGPPHVGIRVRPKVCTLRTAGSHYRTACAESARRDDPVAPVRPDHCIAHRALAHLLEGALAGRLLLFLLSAVILRGVLLVRFGASRQRARHDEESSRNRGRALPECPIGRRHGVPVAAICGSNCGDF